MQDSSSQNAEQGKERAFTVRSVAIGLIGSTIVAGYSYFNDYGMKQTYFVGNHFPLTIYSAFFAFLLLVNPLLRKLGHSTSFAAAMGALGWAMFGGISWLLASWWPVLAFGAVFLAVVAFAMVFRVKPLRPFSAGELVVILSMALVAASLPTSGLMRNFPQILVLPQHYGKAIPGWEKAQPLKYVEEVNPNLFPERDEKGIVYDGYVQGIRKGRTLPPLKEAWDRTWKGEKDTIGKSEPGEEAERQTKVLPIQGWSWRLVTGVWDHLNNMPLKAWIRPAWAWFPALIVYFIFILAMLRIVHRQWSENEQLSYPIAEFANALLRRESGRTFSDVFYNRPFWIAFGAVVFYHVVNGWHAYDPRMIEIPLKWNLGSIFWSKMQFFHKSAGSFYLIYYGVIYLTVVGFAYLLPEEISFSLGISLPLLMLFSSTSYALGHHVTWDEFLAMTFGAYVAMAGVILYTGRYYYWAVIRGAFFLKIQDDVDRGAVWACRWFILSCAGFVLMLMSLGLDWMLSSLCVMIIGILFLVLARASAETGAPFIQSHLVCNKIIYAVLGPAALGPAAMYILQLVGITFMLDNRECLSPFAVNGFRMGTRNGVEPAGLSRAMILALVVGLFASGIGALWVFYDQGAMQDGWMGSSVPNSFAQEMSREVQKLKRIGKLEESVQVSGVSRLSSDVRETRPFFVTAFAVGVGLVLMNSFLRLRYVWWPLHSVLFLFWGQWAPSNFIASFLLGWLIKVCVVRFGGGKAYQDMKPLFIGIIIGDLSGGVLLMIFGTLRYCWTGLEPVRYGIFPG